MAAYLERWSSQWRPDEIRIDPAESQIKVDRTCVVCGRTKPLDMYYRHRATSLGRARVCKTCFNAKAKTWVVANREKSRGIKRRWREAHPDQQRQCELYYRATHLEETRERSRKYEQANKDKKRAHRLLHYAVKTGKITPPVVCEQCGASGKLHGHHCDYNLPLDVQWLCAKCHRALTIIPAEK